MLHVPLQVLDANGDLVPDWLVTFGDEQQKRNGAPVAGLNASQQDGRKVVGI